MKIQLLLIGTKRGDRFVVSDLDADLRPNFLKGDGRLARAGRKIHEFYEKLKDRLDYQEHVCSSLRHASQLTIVHPESVTEEEASHSFEQFLGHQTRKHSAWLVVDSVLALLGSLLTPVPGPNLFFFYPAARALSHYLARAGCKKARHLQVLCYKAESELDKVTRNLDNLERVTTEIEELESRYNFTKLRLLLERI